MFKAQNVRLLFSGKPLFHPFNLTIENGENSFILTDKINLSKNKHHLHILLNALNYYSFKCMQLFNKRNSKDDLAKAIIQHVNSDSLTIKANSVSLLQKVKYSR